MSVEYAMNVPLSAKQMEALRVIANEDDGGKPLDIDTIVSRLSYKTTKQSFQFTIRSLINRELISKMKCTTVRGKSRRLLKITSLGLFRLHSEFGRADKPADAKTCMIDEIEKTNRLLDEIYDDLDIV